MKLQKLQQMVTDSKVLFNVDGRKFVTVHSGYRNSIFQLMVMFAIEVACEIRCVVSILTRR